MRHCPHCHADSLSLCRVAKSTERRPIRCPECNQYAHLASWANGAGAIVLELCFWVCAALALWLGAGWFVVAALFGAPFALVVISALCPLHKLQDTEGVNFRSPSRFYPGNP